MTAALEPFAFERREPGARDVVTDALMPRRSSLAGSSIGGIRETREMLDFCANHGITADIFVIDMKSL